MGWRATLLDVVDRFGAAALAGLGCGFVIGGLGGRLAMLVLRLTSSDALHGLKTDDDFAIGEVTTDSLFLIGAMTLIGTLLAFAYLLVRRWLPERHRPLQSAVVFGLVGGGAVIHPGGVDFTLLDPLWLAIALFVALTAAYGSAMAASIEWLVDHPGRLRKTRVAFIVLFVAIGFFGLIPVGIAVAMLLAAAIGRTWPSVAAWVTHPVPTWIVRLGLLAATVLAAVDLAGDVSEIL